MDIDEKSLQAMGQWPWPRYHLATRLERLTNSVWPAIGLDILLAEQDIA